jgi:hypothetical protein
VGRASWDADSLTGLVWAKQVLAWDGLTAPPPRRLIERAVRTPPGAALRVLRANRLHTAVAARIDNPRSVAGLPAADIPEPLRRQLARQRAAMQLRALGHASTASVIDDALNRAGIAALFTKGLFQAQQFTGDFTFRGVGDIDVLVPPEAYAVASDTLLGLGAADLEKPYPAEFDRVVARVSHARTFRYEQSAVDLHWRIDPMPHLMNPGFSDYWRRRDKVEVAGRSFHTLHPVDAAIYIASHGTQDCWSSLRRVVDLVQGLRVAAPSGDLRELFERAAQLGVRNRVRVGVEVARRLVPELPQQGRRYQVMAQWAWARHRAGRGITGEEVPLDVVGRFVFGSLSAGDVRSLKWAATRLMWLPSMLPEDAGSAPRWLWTYPLSAPVRVTRRVIARSRSGESARTDLPA